LQRSNTHAIELVHHPRPLRPARQPLLPGSQDLGGFGASVEDSEAILAHYLEHGGNFIDTANAYTRGHSEKIIGDFFYQGKARRDSAVIATKFFMNLYAGDPNGGGAGRKAIITQCEASLRRLQTDYIDLYYLHNWDRFTPIEETMSALDDLVKSGKVRYLGFSDAPAWKVSQAQTMAHFRNWNPLIALQIEYSLMERTVEGELTPMAQELGLGVCPWGPLKGGALTGKYTRANGEKMQGLRGARVGAFTERQFDIIDAVARVANECNTSSSAIALAWLKSQPGVSSPIIGASTLSQLKANLEALDVTLTPEQITSLKDASKPTLNFPFDFLAHSPSIAHAGATVNGVPSQAIFLVPKNESERW
jgi:aryl-alcohol dehydrogenase-like predicted oxidoreductase